MGISKILSFYYFILLLFGDDDRGGGVFPISSFSFFLTGSDISPLCCPFPLSPSFQRMCFLLCVLYSLPFRLPPRFTPTSESLPRCRHCGLPGFLQSFLHQVDILSAMASTQFLAATSYPASHLSCFPKARAQSVTDSSVEIRF